MFLSNATAAESEEAEATLLTNDPLARWGDVSLGRSRTTKTCTDPDSWVCGRGMTD